MAAPARQTDDLRRALVGLAGVGGETQEDVLRAIHAIREQLVLVEQLAMVLAAGRVP